MTVLIIEDEARAAQRLAKMVQEIQPGVHLPEPLESVAASLQWLQDHPEPDVVLMDIELADGKSFEILARHSLGCKVIFCTAFDQYAIEAFRHQGLAYLLKPVKKAELDEALKRVVKEQAPAVDYDQLAEALMRRESAYQKRLLVRLGQRYKAIPADEVAYAFTDKKNVMVMTTKGKEIPVDHSLEQLQQLLDPRHFFRINRKLLVHIKAIESMYAWSRSRIRLELLPAKDLDSVVATDRVSDFKAWLEGK